MFRTVYDRVRVFSCHGSPTEPTYKLKVDDSGKRDLVVTGKTNVYDKIQSYKESVDIHVILKRFANGDESALNAKQAVYGDFTDMPKTLAELSQRIIDAEDMFYQLPLDVRADFNHSPSEFFSQFGSDKFNRALGIEKVDPEKVKDVVPNPVDPNPVDPNPVSIEGGDDNVA